jgi:ribosomal protein L16/L10AE
MDMLMKAMKGGGDKMGDGMGKIYGMVAKYMEKLPATA